ncbi:hypothetical protein JCM1840_005092 [Sporobolomyces johnsonii]
MSSLLHDDKRPPRIRDLLDVSLTFMKVAGARYRNPCVLDGLANLMVQGTKYRRHQKQLQALQTLETITLPPGENVNVWSGSQVERNPADADYVAGCLNLTPLLPRAWPFKEEPDFCHSVGHIRCLRPTAALIFALDRIVHSAKPRPADLFMLRMLVKLRDQAILHGQPDFWLDPKVWEKIVVEVFPGLEGYSSFVDDVESKLNHEAIESGAKWEAECRGEPAIGRIREGWVQTKELIMNFIKVSKVDHLYGGATSRFDSPGLHPGAQVDSPIGSGTDKKSPRVAPPIPPNPYAPEGRRRTLPHIAIRTDASASDPHGSPSASQAPHGTPFHPSPFDRNWSFAQPPSGRSNRGGESSLGPSQRGTPTASPSQSRRPSFFRRPSFDPDVLFRGLSIGSRRSSAVDRTPDESADDGDQKSQKEWFGGGHW